VLNSTIAGNNASGNGGGIEANSGSVIELNNATIAINKAGTALLGGTGGGVNLSNALLTASNTVLAVNAGDSSVQAKDVPSDVQKTLISLDIPCCLTSNSQQIEPYSLLLTSTRIQLFLEVVAKNAAHCCSTFVLSHLGHFTLLASYSARVKTVENFF